MSPVWKWDTNFMKKVVDQLARLRGVQSIRNHGQQTCKKGPEEIRGGRADERLVGGEARGEIAKSR
jgi:hypothetical protein